MPDPFERELALSHYCFGDVSRTMRPKNSPLRPAAETWVWANVYHYAVGDGH